MSRNTQGKKPANKLLSGIVAIVVLLLAGFGVIDLPEAEVNTSANVTAAQTQQATEAPRQEAKTEKASEQKAEAPKQETKTEKQAKKATGPIIEPQAIADYLFEHGKLPDNFITKKEAQAMGWDSAKNDVSDVAPGYSIGGDRFGNYEGLLPKKKGRTWYEADCYYTSGNRNAHRIVYSNDGLVYYTDDHYESFTEMKPSGK